jgi:hypothetical protein
VVSGLGRVVEVWWVRFAGDGTVAGVRGKASNYGLYEERRNIVTH